MLLGPQQPPAPSTHGGYVTKPLSLLDLPSDVLGDIFCRLSCESALLGTVAKVNREFREIALEPHTRKCVQENFVEVHKKQCAKCECLAREVQDIALFNGLLSAASSGSLLCVIYISAITKGKLTDNAPSAWTILHHAAINGRHQVIRYLFDAIGILAAKHNKGETILHYAALSDHLDIIQYVIEERGDTELLSRTSTNGDTVLHSAVMSGYMDAIRYLVDEKGATDLITKPTGFGATVLHLAAQFGQIKVLRYFVDERGYTDFAARTRTGDTLLHYAALYGRLDIVRYIVEEKGGADLINLTNNDGETALDRAQCSRKTEVADYLLSKVMKENR